MPSCPTCGDEFDTRRGLGVHHSSVHDRKLPNRTCGLCGERFHSPYEKKYCSEECHDEGVSYEGTANPNYRGGREQTECLICGSEFEYYESEKEGNYCSECVETEKWRNPPSISGTEHPRWNGGPVTLSCEVCDSEFERTPGNITSDVTCCSESCRAEWLSEAFTGEGHPNWKGGGNQEYGQGWNEARERALERDGYECQLCGTTADELGRNPDVHHVVPVRAYDASDGHDIEDAHTLDNLVSLCPGCHRKAEFGVVGRDRLTALAAIDGVDAAPERVP